jgi:DNA-directed RNA polymerase subunit H (RpoH/RPB5)
MGIREPTCAGHNPNNDDKHEKPTQTPEVAMFLGVFECISNFVENITEHDQLQILWRQKSNLQIKNIESMRKLFENVRLYIEQHNESITSNSSEAEINNPIASFVFITTEARTYVVLGPKNTCVNRNTDLIKLLRATGAGEKVIISPVEPRKVNDKYSTLPLLAFVGRPDRPGYSRHSIISKEELMDVGGINSPDMLVPINNTDPAIVWLRGKPGDIVRIDRHSQRTVSIPMFRRVIDSGYVGLAFN